MKITEIKRKMEELFVAFVERNDESYFEFYNALHTLRALNMITEEMWKKIYTYDRKLAQVYLDL